MVGEEPDRRLATGATARPLVPEKKPVSWENIALGAFIQVWEVSTLGQVFEVVKTHMAGARPRASARC
ncbi:MAG: hypothetical protein BJ554DRAFT_596 [Olpidium bornovanus]|uniref:Uncharacterized protein n=1 Tax=Olpidium bornovanus TaxID=278681 RepID=A0A8H7ZTI2_9FUNG|nr:MAG: hypothetical protein BJ554DRAFT_596 [Olpidium bornovanus]